MRKLLPVLSGFLLASTVTASGEMPTHVNPVVNPVAVNPNGIVVNLPTKSVLLNVPLIAQKNCCWCWAAGGEMVMTYTGHPIPQCTQATYQFGAAAGKNCCDSPTPGICVQGGQIEIGHYGYTYQQVGGSTPLTASQIENDIGNRHMPWLLNPHGPGFGHVTVGIGYETINGTLALVAVNDPWPPNTGDFYWES